MPQNPIRHPSEAAGDGCRSEIAAIVLAAGYSTRMQAFKPLLPFGDSTMVEQVITTLRSVGLETIRVVVGWQAERLIPVVERDGVLWVQNLRYPEGMYTSVQAGVRELPGQVKAFFVLPVDMPLVRRSTLRQLLAAWDVRTKGILYPVWNGQRGHPPLIDARYISEILAAPASVGLRSILARHSEDARNIECADPGILRDLDAPEEYRRALCEQRGLDAPGQPSGSGDGFPLA